MTPFRSLVLFSAGIAALSLTACGEGYEATRYEGFPYNNERTAGPGVAYVLARMLPEKGPVLEPVTPPPPAPPPAEEVLEPALEGTQTPIKDAEPMFDRMQQGKK